MGHAPALEEHPPRVLTDRLLEDEFRVFEMASEESDLAMFSVQLVTAGPKSLDNLPYF